MRKIHVVSTPLEISSSICEDLPSISSSYENSTHETSWNHQTVTCWTNIHLHQLHPPAPSLGFTRQFHPVEGSLKTSSPKKKTTSSWHSPDFDLWRVFIFKKSIIPYFPGIIITPPFFFRRQKWFRPPIRGPKVRLGKITSPISPTWSLCGWSCTREKASDFSAMSCCEQTRWPSCQEQKSYIYIYI